MDNLTHIALGGVVAYACFGKKIGRFAWLAGGIAATIPDLDVFIKTGDVIVDRLMHRHFSHSLLVIPVIALVAMAVLMFFKRARENYKTVFLAAMVGVATHGLLDAFTSYGTLLFWPFNYTRVAWDMIAVIDPIFTMIVLVGLIVAAKKRSEKVARVAVALAVAYLGLGFVQHERAAAAQRTLAESRGHIMERSRVTPQLGSILVWRGMYEFEGKLYADGIRTPFLGSTVARPSSGPVQRLAVEDLRPLPVDDRLDDPAATPALHHPRPGHADLAGAVKWLTNDCREVLERASARETTARVAAGGVAKCLLKAFDIDVFGFVRAVGPATPDFAVTPDNWRQLLAQRDASEVYCPDAAADAAMKEFINQAKINKDTAGGVVECHVFNCPVGIGSCLTWDGRLDSRIAAAVMGIQAFKGVEIGMGFGVADRFGSQVHDEIAFDPAKRNTPSLGFARKTNNAGGLEGGMTNGQPIIVKGAMKPISTLGKPLNSIDLRTKESSAAGWERSDISAISAASVVLEAVVAFEVARAMIEKFGGDSLLEMKQNYDAYLNAARKFV